MCLQVMSDEVVEDEIIEATDATLTPTKVPATAMQHCRRERVYARWLLWMIWDTRTSSPRPLRAGEMQSAMLL